MKKKNFIQTLMKYSIISWISFLISVISIPIMTRIYPPEQMGGITMFHSTIGLFMLIAIGGQDQSLARFYHECEKKGEISFEVYKISTLMWLSSFSMLFIMADMLSRVFFGEVNHYAMLMVGIGSLPLSYLRLSEQIYRMKSDTKNYGLQQIVVNFITRLVVLLSAFISKEYNFYITVYFIVIFILTIYYLIKQFKLRNIHISKHIVNKQTIELLKFGTPNMLASILYSLKDFIPRIVLSSQTSLYNVGIYSSAISISSMINILQAGFSTYYGAYFYENYKSNSGKFERIHHALTAILVFVAITMTFSKDILVNILGDAYKYAGDILPMMLWSPVAISISETTVYGINIAKKAKYHVYISLITTILTICLSFLLIPKYEEVGAALSMGLSGLTFLLLRTFFGFRFLKTVTRFEKTLFSMTIMILYTSITSLYDPSFSIRISMYIFFTCLLILIYRDLLKTTLDNWKNRRS